MCAMKWLGGGKCSIQIMHVSHTFEIGSFKFSLHGVNQKTIIIIMHILKVENYILFSRLSENSSLGYLSAISEKLLLRGQGRASIQKGFCNTNSVVGT